MIHDPTQLQLLYQLNRRLAEFDDLEELLRYATTRVRDLFSAEGCTLLLLDRSGKELYFPLAGRSGSAETADARLAGIRFPADRGIAGWVLAHDEGAYIPDTQADRRLYHGVDQELGSVTRSMLCAPLRVASRNIGVIEVINLEPSACTEGNLRFLEAVATDIAVAHEKAMLYERLRTDTQVLTLLGTLAGAGIFALGLLMAAGAAYGHLARALPLSTLATLPRLWIGVAIAVAGASVVAATRGWIRRGL